MVIIAGGDKEGVQRQFEMSYKKYKQPQTKDGRVSFKTHSFIS